MKILHWAFVFVAIILPISIICRNTVNSRFTALKDEVRINNAIDTATKDAIDQIISANIIEFDNEFGDAINVTPALAQETINTFFHTLAINFNIPYKVSDATLVDGDSSESYIKNYFAQYVPAIVITAYDGFYVYSQEYSSSKGYRYELSSKIPYTYDYKNGNRSYSIGYTLGDDIYLYVDGKCYSGKMKHNSFAEIEKEYNDNYTYEMNGRKYHFSTSEIAAITNDISMVMYSLQNVDNDVTFESNILPKSSDKDFLMDYTLDKNGNYIVGNFHKNRRKVIIDKITACLNKEFNEQNMFADAIGSTYDFYLPEITDDDWINTINDISVLAFVQGIPVGTLKGTYFNSYALGGSQIIQKEYLYANTIKSKYSGNNVNLYHNSRCDLVKDEKYDYIFINEDEALINGYHPCQLCN